MNKCNQPISYVFWLLNRAKQNYTSSKHETLIILCREYLIQKLQISRGIAQWPLLFFEYGFLVVYKPSQSHLVVDALNFLVTNLYKWTMNIKLNIWYHNFHYIIDLATREIWLSMHKKLSYTFHYWT